MAKAKKRANGEGCIRKLPYGSWEARISFMDSVTGKYLTKTFTRKSQAEVKKWLVEMRAQIHRGEYIGEQKLTVGEWLITWLNEYSKPKVRITTWESYESVSRVHIIPKIGHILLQKLRPEDLQRFYNERIKSGRVKGSGGLSNTTVYYMDAVLNQALKQAVKNGLVIRNVAELVEPPKKAKHDITPLTVDQVKLFLEKSKNHRFYPAFLLEAYTGLRRGELLGLRWQDVDLSQKTISIRKSLTRTKTAGIRIDEPKTKASRRQIPLTSEVVEVLKSLRLSQIEEKLMAGPAYINNDFVFCSPLGRPIDPRYFGRQFTKILKEAGLPIITFHDMRHTHATLLLQLGENPKIVQTRLGHTTVRMTLDTYSHIMPGMQEQATERIGAVLGL